MQKLHEITYKIFIGTFVFAIMVVIINALI